MRFLLVAVTELLPMYQSPNVSIHPRVLIAICTGEREQAVTL